MWLLTRVKNAGFGSISHAGFENPHAGFEDPSAGFENPSAGFTIMWVLNPENPLLMLMLMKSQTLHPRAPLHPPTTSER